MYYSLFEVHTQMCTLCVSVFSFGVSLLKFSFRFPTTYGAHTRPPATSRASGRLTESILEENRHCSSSVVYDCRHKLRTVKCLWKVSRLGDCDLPLREAVVFVCVHVIMCQHLLLYVLSYVWQRFLFRLLQNAMIRLRLLVANKLTK